MNSRIIFLKKIKISSERAIGVISSISNEIINDSNYNLSQIMEKVILKFENKEFIFTAL